MPKLIIEEWKLSIFSACWSKSWVKFHKQKQCYYWANSMQKIKLICNRAKVIEENDWSLAGLRITNQSMLQLSRLLWSNWIFSMPQVKFNKILSANFIFQILDWDNYRESVLVPEGEFSPSPPPILLIDYEVS